MDIDRKLVHDLIYSDTYKSFHCFLDRLDSLITNEIGVEVTDAESSDLFDKEFLKQVEEFSQSNASLHFGKTLRELKCVILDEVFREHIAWIEYIGPKNLCIKDMNLPRAHIQEKVYRSVDEVVNDLRKHVAELSNYFDELSQIDANCIVMEPVRPTFKENYRKIQLDDKIWLHIEVSSNGSAKNLNVLGQFDQQELQELLQAWDRDKPIARNVLTIISSLECQMRRETKQAAAAPECAICYCVELTGDIRVPQPLCNNSKCGAYFHRSCLYEWLVACAGGRTPQFGVGKCPSCSQYIQCSDADIRQ